MILTKLKKPELLKEAEHLENKVSYLEYKIRRLEYDSKSSEAYTQLQVEKQKLADKNHQLEQKLDDLRDVIDVEYGSMLYQVRELVDKLNALTQPYSVADNYFSDLKKQVESDPKLKEIVTQAITVLQSSLFEIEKEL